MLQGEQTMMRQRTLKATIKTTGVGLHTGVRVELVLRPAQPDTGKGCVSLTANARPPVPVMSGARPPTTVAKSSLRPFGASFAT